MAKALPNRGISAPQDYIDSFRHNFPGLPLAAIKEAWKHHATPSEYRSHMERTKGAK